MPLPRQLLQIDFDQFHRYAAVTLLLRPLIAELNRPVRLLEVGSHSLHLLPAFLAPLPVEIVRADLEPMLAGDLGTYITLEKDAAFPFEDDSYDFTVAMEVLEHIPSEDRTIAMGEWARVASHGILFSCPAGNRVQSREARADADFQARHGRVHPWLEEHARFGWPTRQEVESLCDTLGLTCHRFQNSPLAEWLPLLLATEQIFERGDQELTRRFNEMLNLRPFRAFIQEPPYRNIFAAFKSNADKNQALQLWKKENQLSRGNSTYDATRVLAKQLTQFVKEHRQRAVDRQALEQAQRQTTEQKQLLHHQQLALRWESWQRENPSRSLRSSPSCNLLLNSQKQDVEPFGPFHWKVNGPAPAFEWAATFSVGWHVVSVTGQMQQGQYAILSIDYGHGFSDQHVVKLGFPISGWQSLSLHAYFHHPVRRCQLTIIPPGKEVVIEHFSILPRHPVQVAGSGVGLLLRDLLHQPLKTLSEVWAAPSIPRWCLDRTIRQPERIQTPYLEWLCSQRPDRNGLQQLILQHRTGSEKLVYFIKLNEEHDQEDILSTWRSLLAQYESPWHLYLAAPSSILDYWLNHPEWQPHRERITGMATRPDRGLAGLLNQCVQETSADWIVPLQPGDLLEPDTCLQYLEAARITPPSSVLYADEDVQATHTLLEQPLFKPMFHQETLCQQPELIGQAVAIHGPTLQKLGGFNPSYDGALVAEYMLRVLTSGHQLTQVPRVLLHQKQRSVVTPSIQLVHERLADDYHPGAYQIDTARIVVQDTASRMLPAPEYTSQDLISIIIPSAGRLIASDGTSHLKRCLASLREKSTWSRLELLVVHQDALHDQAEQAMKQYDARPVVVPGPFSYSRNINHAARVAQGEYLLLLNDDIEIITPDWLQQMMRFAHSEVGAIGSKLLFPTGQIQHVGISLSNGIPMHPYYGRSQEDGYFDCCHSPRNCLAVTAACMLTNWTAFEKLQGFDESFELNYNDVDYCLRLWQAGYRVVINPRVELYHHEVMRRDGRAAYRPEELRRFQQRWNPIYPHDPFLRLPPGEEIC